MNLNFIGPFTLIDGKSSVFNSLYIKSKGVYLWTIKQKKENYHLIHYVGESKFFAKRQKEHLNSILGLYYGIFDPEKAQNGKLEILWKGTWRIKDNNGPSLQLKAYEKLSSIILKYISVINIFFAETESIDDNKRKHIEGSIGWNLRKKYPEFKVLYPDDNHIGTRLNKYNEKLTITTQEEIKGIDNELEI